MTEIESSTDYQIGGTHYKDMKIQPIMLIELNNLGFSAGCVVKYICRWRTKNGVEDLRKCVQYLEFMRDNRFRNQRPRHQSSGMKVDWFIHENKIPEIEANIIREVIKADSIPAHDDFRWHLTDKIIAMVKGLIQMEITINASD